MMDHKCIKVLRVLLPAFIGLCLGVTMSMMYAPFSEDSCETFLSRQDPQQLVHMRGTKSLETQEVESFEPRIRQPLDQPGDSAGEEVVPASKSKLVRPRYATTELGIREKLFVGVVTTKSTIGTLSVALNKTVSSYVTKLVFFMDEKGPTVPSGMTIVNFADNHPHLVPVHMLKYVTEHFSDTFDYYMFVTDKAYIRAESVFDLVSHISVSQHVHMGSVKSTEAGKTFCHLEGGIIISQSLLDRVKADMEWCLSKCHHNDQSLNFGKCLLHATDMACTDQGGQVKKFKVYNVNGLNQETLNKLSLIPEFNASHTVFPMPDDFNHYKLHRYFCEHDLNTTRQEIEKMKENVLYMSQFAPGGRESISWPIGVPEPYKPKNRFDVIRWDYFTENLIYFQDDFTNVKPLKGADKLDIQEVVKVSVERLNAKYNNIYLYLSLNNGYRRFDPQRGMEYILDVTLRDTSDGREVQKRVQLVRPLGQVEIVPMPYVTETTQLHLILPVMEDDKEGVGTFLDAYAHTCLDTQENAELLIAFVYKHIPLPDEEDTFSVLKSMVAYYNKKYAESGTRIEWIALQSNGSFVSDFHIMEVVTRRFPPDSLILLCTVGMELATDFFNRVRMNTIAEWQVFYPIGFWQYKPNLIYDKKPYPSTIELMNRVGHYDMLSYEHASFYLSDYIKARQLTPADDVLYGDLFEMFIKNSKLHVFRAVEPALKHRYKQLSCLPSYPPSLYQRCLDRRATGLATRAQLAKLIFDYMEHRS